MYGRFSSPVPTSDRIGLRSSKFEPVQASAGPPCNYEYIVCWSLDGRVIIGEIFDALFDLYKRILVPRTCKSKGTLR